jgi:mersacidin/lichenicidin family type 2 lantibiotic
MSIEDIIRAWKDEDFRLSLSAADRALLPDNPAGAIELTDAQLERVGGQKPKPKPKPSNTKSDCSSNRGTSRGCCAFSITIRCDPPIVVKPK